jgi:hypothetical protein
MKLIRRRRTPEGPLATLRSMDWETHLSDPSGDTTSLSFMSGFVVGTSVGILVAMLLAPEREGARRG